MYLQFEELPLTNPGYTTTPLFNTVRTEGEKAAKAVVDGEGNTLSFGDKTGLLRNISLEQRYSEHTRNIEESRTERNLHSLPLRSFPIRQRNSVAPVALAAGPEHIIPTSICLARVIVQ